MIEKLRAIRDSDKNERRKEILDAAERLLVERPSGLASVEELAQASGIAKGTVYLYFPSKEEVLLALHERHVDAIFDALTRRIAETPRFTLESLFELVRLHIIESSAFLPVSTLVVGYMERSVPVEAVIRFKTSLGAKLMQVGGQIERALDLPSGSGPRMLQYSFALIVGLWQITSCGRIAQPYAGCDLASGFVADFPSESRRALDTLWRGAMEPATEAVGAVVVGDDS